MRKRHAQGRLRVKRSARGTSRDARGVALIMVLTAIAIFTAVVVDFSYSSRIELDLAANARDEVRAYFLARSAVNMSRLILHFQKQLDSSPLASGNLPPGLSQLLSGGTSGGAGTPGAAGTTGTSGLPTGAMPGSGGLAIRLWELIPIDSGMIQMFLGGAGVTGEGSSSDHSGELKALATKSDAPVFGKEGALPVGDKGAIKSFGDFSGSFHAEIDDESKKFNVAWLDHFGRVMQMAITRALLMFGDKRYEWLFEEDDANGVRTTAKDIVVNLHDYIDQDQVAATLNPQDAVNPFPPGFSDETQPYSRYKPTYKPKNAPFDSVDELYMVDGIGDKFMSAFRDRLTVFPDKNKAINVNTDDPFMQLVNIYMVAQNPNDPALTNPLIIQQVLRDIQLAKLFTGIGITVPQFIAILQANKITVDPTITANLAGNIKISDKADTFTIHAVGEVGKVQKKLTAVIKYDQGLGQLMYWREE